MANPFVHIELTTSNIAKAKEFYGKLFDWKFESVPVGDDGTYTVIKVGEGTGGGMFQMADAPPMWLSYVLVDDIEAATQKAKSLGAVIIRERHEVPGMGWLSIFSDPQGAMLALWQARKA
jgi:predicted enzyme related to lactoylglutathione lyase